MAFSNAADHELNGESVNDIARRLETCFATVFPVEPEQRANQEPSPATVWQAAACVCFRPADHADSTASNRKPGWH